nr:zinc finger protein 181 isoform X6 [Helicoverpa armigera]
MDAKTSEWRAGPNVCRCCLTEGCYKDISTEYFWMGKREVYAEMLADTLNVSISYSQSGGPNSNSRLICELCISRLRDASDFKRQVLECEKSFTQHLDAGASNILELDVTVEPADSDVKLEHVKQEKRLSDDDDDFDDRCGFDDDDDDDLDDQPLTKLATKIPKKETVDILDLLDNSKATEKRKSSTKTKAVPAKKTKSVKKEPVKAGASKVVAKTDKKKKGVRWQASEENIQNEEDYILKLPKQKYTRSPRAEARIITKNNASAILQCWSVLPFRWKKNRFKCAYCEDNFTDCSELRAHVRICAVNHSIKDIYSKFKEMPLINVDVTEASCSFCSMPLSNVTELREHAILHGLDFNPYHPDGVLPFSLNKQSWQCIICTDKFNNFLKLYEHMNVHYQHYICATCGKGFMTSPRLRKHLEVHISGSFPCDKCGRIFIMRAARDSHKASAHPKAPRYECPHCNIRFDNYYDRVDHMKNAHSEREVSYSCPHCELSFKTSGKRAIHVRTVHFPPQLNFSCSYCEWQFRTNYELKRHMVRHTGEKNFHCTICGKSFPRNRALTNHLKVHQDVNSKWRGPVFKQRTQRLPSLNPHDLTDLVPTEIKI